MKRFVDRKGDLATLEEQFASEEASLVVLYGRRRVGKTALITKFLQNKKGVYFLATEESEEQNRLAFQRQVAAVTGDTLLTNASIDSWEPLFDRLTQGPERIVLALDEFQYLGKANVAFPSVFQHIWDTLLSKRNVMVILCGSLISLMVSQTLAYDSPLYGRRTAQIRMVQIPFKYYADFFDHSLSRRSLVGRYSVTGGVPKYIERFADRKEIFRAIEDNVLSRNSFLFDEPNFLLSKEVGEVGSYFSIIRAIAAGNRRSGEIAASMNVKQTSLTKYLKVLESLDILQRDVPATEAHPEKSKRGFYRIKDNYLRFWFRFVFPNLGLLETGHQDVVLEQIRQNFIDGHVSYVYEAVCRDRIWDLAAEDEFPFMPSRVGAWWGTRDIEIDLLALNDVGDRVAFGECKFWRSPVGVNVLDDLEDKARRAQQSSGFGPYKDAEALFVIFSISGFTESLKKKAAERSDVLLFD